jgi:hypothetical protein
MTDCVKGSQLQRRKGLRKGKHNKQHSTTLKGTRKLHLAPAFSAAWENSTSKERTNWEEKK